MLNEFICEKELSLNIASVLAKHTSASFLFSGIEGIGKKTLASIISNNLLNMKEADSSLIKSNPLILLKSTLHKTKEENLFFNNTHPDFFLMYSEEKKKISIEETRQLKLFFNNTKSISNVKVVIIDTIEDLTLNAINMILKLLEEPPENTYIFIISNKPSNVLKTIESRLFKFYFKPLKKEEFFRVSSKLNIKNNPEENNFLSSIYINSPGLAKKYYDKNLFEKYLNLLDYFQRLLKNSTLDNSFEFVKTKASFKDEYNYITLVNRVVKNVLLIMTEDKIPDDLSEFESSLFYSLSNEYKFNNLYEKYVNLQKDLYYSEQLNVRKLDVIDNFINSFNYQ